MSAVVSLQTAIFALLSSDAALTAMIGTGGVHDHLQSRVDRPCIFLAGIDTRDASTSSETAEEHLITIEVRTGEGGNRLAGEIASRVRALLDDADLVVSGFTLVSILHRRTRMARDPKARGHVAEMFFRAVTE